MLDRLRGTYRGPPSMKSVVATLVVLGILVRIAAMFTSLDVSGQTPIMLCGCGYWTQLSQPMVSLSAAVLLAVLVSTILYAASGGFPRM